MKKYRTLAIIPARGGSKRIPKKNIKKFFGRPIIQYSIEAAKKSKIFDEIMVSTDSEEIADVAKGAGATVPFYRSQKNSNDKADINSALREVISEYKDRRKNFDYVFCIFATAPLIRANKLKEAAKILFSDPGLDYVIPVASFDYPIQRALKIKDGRLKMFDNSMFEKRSQDLVPAYHDAGQFFGARTESIFKYKNPFKSNIFPIIIPSTEVQDLDTLDDWELAEIKFKSISSIDNNRK